MTGTIDDVLKQAEALEASGLVDDQDVFGLGDES